MPAPKKQIFAYAVVNTVRTVEPPSLDLSGFPPLPAIGEIACYEEDHGRNTHTESRIDGPLFDTVVFRYVGTGEIVDGEPVFDDGAKRLMALIQIGAQNERVLRDTTHQLLEQIREGLDEQYGPMSGPAIATIDTVEKAFLR